MKLSELLDKLEPGARIKIGANDGHSYFYVGSPADFFSHYFNYNAAVKSAAKRSLYLAERDYFLAKSEKLISDKVTEKLRRARFRVENLVELKDRDVVDHFQSDGAVDEDVTAIIVDGFEAGSFWCIEDASAFPAISC